jgi:hypothetical protein
MGQVYTCPSCAKKIEDGQDWSLVWKAGRRRDPSPRGGLRDESDAPLSPGVAEARFGGRDAEEEAIKTGATPRMHVT